jgi:hypothetical protein
MQSLFPDLGDGFVLVALRYFDMDLERAVDAVVSSALPPPLQRVPRDLRRRDAASYTGAPVICPPSVLCCADDERVRPPQWSLVPSTRVRCAQASASSLIVRRAEPTPLLDRRLDATEAPLDLRSVDRLPDSALQPRRVCVAARAVPGGVG